MPNSKKDWNALAQAIGAHAFELTVAWMQANQLVEPKEAAEANRVALAAQKDYIEKVLAEEKPEQD